MVAMHLHNYHSFFACIWLLGFQRAWADSPPIKYHDDAMFYSVITPSPFEFNASFPGQSEAFGVLHVWLRCVNLELRSFFFFESLSFLRGPAIGARGGGFKSDWAASQAVEFTSAFAMIVNGSVAPIRVDPGGGGTYTVRLAHDIADQTVIVGVSNWSSYVRFPLSRCRNVSIPEGQSRGRVISVFLNEEESVSASGLADVAEALVKHARYHTCVLKSPLYEIVAQEDSAPYLLGHRHFALLHKKGVLQILFRGPRPANIRGFGVFGFAWQSVAYNLAILRHWRQNNLVFMIDSDEYLVVNASRAEEVKHAFEHAGKLVLRRRDVSCTRCITRSLETLHLNMWQTFGFLQSPKVAVFPDLTYAMYVHDAESEHPVWLDSDAAALYHVADLFRARGSAIRNATPSPVAWDVVSEFFGRNKLDSGCLTL